MRPGLGARGWGLGTGMCIVHPPHFLGSFCNPVFLKALRGLWAGLGAGFGGTGVGGAARRLVRFQLAETAVDGALRGAFVAGELGERVGTFAINVEGASQEVALDRKSTRLNSSH